MEMGPLYLGLEGTKYNYKIKGARLTYAKLVKFKPPSLAKSKKLENLICRPYSFLDETLKGPNHEIFIGEFYYIIQACMRGEKGTRKLN
jgi:hypothetical protein